MSPYVWAWVAFVGFGAGWVRGFAGFGFSVLCMAGLAWYVSPALVVPVVVMLEMFASIQLWRGALHCADKRWLMSLVALNVVAVPFGVGLLVWVPVEPLRAVVAVLLFVAAFTMRFVLRTQLTDSTWLRRSCGAAAGLLNGLAASGGIVVGLTMAAAGVQASALRATMIVYLLCADAYAMLLMLLAYWLAPKAENVFFTDQTPLLLMALGVPMLVGVYLGKRVFQQTSGKDYRAFVLNLLVFLTSVGLLRLWFI
ncbi:Sulfite exporter TauE/SafE [Betaproteobacteria bacterium MOLA814]|nr:Sulfite exporter TauE/SafE [Betaproteobacteria bacterium MOLA814]